MKGISLNTLTPLPTDMIYEVVRSSGNVMFNFDSESTPEGRRMTKLDQILLNGNNITMVCKSKNVDKIFGQCLLKVIIVNPLFVGTRCLCRLWRQSLPSMWKKSPQTLHTHKHWCSCLFFFFFFMETFASREYFVQPELLPWIYYVFSCSLLLISFQLIPGGEYPLSNDLQSSLLKCKFYHL